MDFLEKIKGFIGSLFPNLNSFIKIQINCDNTTNNIDYDDNSKQVSVNIGKLEIEDKENLGKLLKEAVSEEGFCLLENESANLLEDFKKEDKSSETQNILQKLTKILPPEDVPIWRASLYLKSRFEAGKQLDHLKKDIIQKYGAKGRNISNLCTAGYLQNQLIPLYDELKNVIGDEKLATEKFHLFYNNMVEELPYTVFVSHWNTIEKLKKTIEDKINNNLKYGIRFLNIHAINKDNVKKVRKIIGKLEESYNITTKIEEERNIIYVRIGIEDPPILENNSTENPTET